MCQAVQTGNNQEKRGGMLHSQLIGEQMKGAQELREDTAQKMKTIELREKIYPNGVPNIYLL